MMMEAVSTSETSVDNHFTRQYNPEDSSEHQGCLLFIYLCKSVHIPCSTGWYDHSLFKAEILLHNILEIDLYFKQETTLISISEMFVFNNNPLP
jgi:hypothetical protein